MARYDRTIVNFLISLAITLLVLGAFMAPDRGAYADLGNGSGDAITNCIYCTEKDCEAQSACNGLQDHCYAIPEDCNVMKCCCKYQNGTSGPCVCKL